MKRHLVGGLSKLRLLFESALLMLCLGIMPLFAAPETPPNDSLIIEALRTNLTIQFRAGNLDSAFIIVSQIKDIAEKAGMEKRLADCNTNFGLIERSRGNNEASISYYTLAAADYLRLEELGAAARAHTAIGQIYVNLQQYRSAMEHFSASLRLRESENDSLGIANNLINMGGASYFAGGLADAGDFYYRALRIVDLLNNMPLKAQVLMNLSQIHVKQNNHPIAIEYLEQALTLRRQQGDRKSESDVLMNLGISYYEQGLIDAAEKHFLESLEIKEMLKTDVAGMIKLYNNLGLVAKNRNDNAKAVFFYNKTIELARLTGDKQSEAIAMNNLGSRLMSQSEDEALPVLMKSLEQAIHLGLKHLELSNYDNLRLYYAEKENFQEAYSYLFKYQMLNDSIYNANNAARIAELQTQYDTELKDKENQMLKDNERLLRLRVLIMSVSAFGIAVLATFFFILFHMKRKSLVQSRALLEARDVLHRIENEKNKEQKKHLQAVLFAEEEITRLQKTQLHEKDRELSASTLHIINKNEVLNNIRLLATKALSTDNCEGKNCIEKLIREIDSNVNLDEQWEQFKRHFESVHAGFFARLNRQFPDLTQNELKLCAYLKMNLSTKEIAQMLNIEVDSATTKRYRLRKKLKLESDNNLVSFLIDF